MEQFLINALAIFGGATLWFLFIYFILSPIVWKIMDYCDKVNKERKERKEKKASKETSVVQ